MWKHGLEPSQPDTPNDFFTRGKSVSTTEKRENGFSYFYIVTENLI